MASIVVSGDTSGAITISAPTTAGTNTLSLPANTGTAILDYSTPAYRNRIINGAMMIDQRNAGASVNNAAATGTYTLDRWRYYGTSANKFSVQQNAGSVTPPAGFINYLGVTSLSANSPASSDEYVIQQFVEGLNIADLAWGTASAKTVTLSFQVYSSLTGSFSGAVKNSASDRTYPFSYTVSSANTWTSISVTIPGDTNGTWLTTNGRGLQVMWNLGAGSTNLTTGGAWTSTYADGVTGSVNVLGTNGATFYITGVQLEKGSTATSFDYRPYGTELALCQRYYLKNTGVVDGGGVSFATIYRDIIVGVKVNFPVEMRATPTLTMVGTTGRSGGDADGQEISTIGFSWGRKKTGTGSADVYAFSNGGFTVESEL